jgi:coenzyme Q-binding protein COQ10
MSMTGVLRPAYIASYSWTPQLILRRGPTYFQQPAITRQPQQIRTFIDSFLNSALGPCPLRKLTHTKTLPYSSKAVFKVISDVSGYPSFLPFTISSQVISRDSLGYPTRAKLRVGYAKLGLEEDWESLVKCDPSDGMVEARSSNSNSQGLFEVLSTKWKIDALPRQHDNQTSVKLDVDVKFRSLVYDQMFAQVEEKVANAMISAFEKRVQEIETAK